MKELKESKDKGRESPREEIKKTDQQSAIPPMPSANIFAPTSKPVTSSPIQFSSHEFMPSFNFSQEKNLDLNVDKPIRTPLYHLVISQDNVEMCSSLQRGGFTTKLFREDSLHCDSLCELEAIIGSFSMPQPLKLVAELEALTQQRSDDRRDKLSNYSPP